MKWFSVCILLVMVSACNSNSGLEKEIAAVPVHVKIERFDKAFATTSVEKLPELKKMYPQFFPKQYADSIWEQRINDTLQRQLHQEVEKIFPYENDLEQVIEKLFQHVKFYFPDFKEPIIYTTTSDVDYKNKVILTNGILVIALDTYLGSDHYFYGGIQKYLTKNLKASQIGPDIASEFARHYVSVPQHRSFLEQIIYYGKELYLKDLWLTDLSDAEKIGYTDAELSWAQENEIDIWRYFVEEELLYSTDVKLAPRFINPAPFSKFYLEIDNDSPGMIGRYLGWQIVRSYMSHNSVSIQQLMIMGGDEVFKNSKYKPKK